MRRAGAFAALLLASWVAHAEPTAVGRWTQVDDGDGQARSVLRIEEKGGVFEAVIEKIFFRAGETDTDPVCSKCRDARRGQKIVGMKILSGLRREGLGYEGGEILDPDNGKVYRARARLSADGKSLEVRGFIGISLIGRSQTWVRRQP